MGHKNKQLKLFDSDQDRLLEVVYKDGQFDQAIDHAIKKTGYRPHVIIVKPEPERGRKESKADGGRGIYQNSK